MRKLLASTGTPTHSSCAATQVAGCLATLHARPRSVAALDVIFSTLCLETPIHLHRMVVVGDLKLATLSLTYDLDFQPLVSHSH